MAADLRLGDIAWDSDGRTLVHLEGRSDRGVLVAHSKDGAAPRDLTTELNVRAEVGYGGGDFTVAAGHVYFAVQGSGRLYRQPLASGAARPITPAFGKAANPVVSPDNRVVAYVHHDDDQIDRIAAVDVEGTLWPQILTDGHDFYMQPRFSPDGRLFAWIAWDHPNMPWDGTRLYLASVVSDGETLPRLTEPRVIAGGDEIAIFQPEFTPDGKTLLFASDESGWSRIAAYDLATAKVRWLVDDEAEYGMPAWVQDVRTYGVSADSRYVVAKRNERGFEQLMRIDIQSGESNAVDAVAEYSDIARVVCSPVDDRVALLASSPTVPPRIVVHDFANGQSRVIARASGETVSPESLSRPRAVSWNTAGDETAHGIYYPPASARFSSSGRPPLIVLVHGGPTSQSRATWHPQSQFFATRGYAVLLVNYRGSTGYGRAYMLRLRENWGICDVEDCLSGAAYLAAEGEIDPARTVIMGGSAGGYTVLQTMVTHPEAFRAGINLYGVSNHFTLASDTHKFEARYEDSLVGPLPEAAAHYRKRSPVFHADKICRPLAVFQGEIDRVVPKAQSDTIVEALKRTGTPHVYHVYEGEGHGWRRRETIEHFYGAVDAFLREHVLFA